MIPLTNIEKQFEAKKGSKVKVSLSGTHAVSNCPSPTHPDNNPSCVIDLGTGHYKCLACGEEGTVSAEGEFVLSV